MNEVKTENNFMSVELLMREFYASKNLQLPKHYYSNSCACKRLT